MILHVDGEARLCPLERALLLLRDFSMYLSVRLGMRLSVKQFPDMLIR